MPEPTANSLQHVLKPDRKLGPCPGCGSTRPPLVGRSAGKRRAVRCLGCGRILMVDAAAPDSEIAVEWNARAGA